MFQAVQPWSLVHFADFVMVLRALLRGGLSHEAAEKKARMMTDCAARLLEEGLPESRLAWALWMPGRIELLGKHTDYAGGRSLTLAIERGLVAIACPRDDQTLSIHDALRGQDRICGLDDPAMQAPAPANQPAADWGNYLNTLARRMIVDWGEGAASRADGDASAPPLVGMELAFASDLPAGAGCASSSALLTSLLLGFATVNGLHQRSTWKRLITGRRLLAEYAAAIEGGHPWGPLAGAPGVGTRGGSQDHVALLCSRPGRVRMYRYGPVELERTASWPEGWWLAVAQSGVVAEKTGAAMGLYNRAADLAQAAAAQWRASTGREDAHLGAICQAWPAAAEQAAELFAAIKTPETPVPFAAADGAVPSPAADCPAFSGDQLLRRLEHFIRESLHAVPAGMKALDDRDPVALGIAAALSQQAAEELLQNQTPETRHLVQAALAEGAAAATSFGAGFGGSAWALIHANQPGAGTDSAIRMEHFLDRWAKTYGHEFPRAGLSARYWQAAPGPAGFYLELVE